MKNETNYLRMLSSAAVINITPKELSDHSNEILFSGGNKLKSFINDGTVFCFYTSQTTNDYQRASRGSWLIIRTKSRKLLAVKRK